MADRFAGLLDEGGVEELVWSRGLRLPAFRMVRQGTLIDTASYTTTASIGQGVVDDLIDPVRVARLYEDGTTLILRGLQRYHPAIAAFCRALTHDLGHPVRANAYVTPSNAQGYGIHYDLHDVFVLQCSGLKHWVVHERQVTDPLPGGGVDPNVRPEDLGAVVIDEVLQPGDSLYIPRGWPHCAFTTGAASIHLTIGVPVFTWLDVLAVALELARATPELRATIPCPADDERFRRGFASASQTLLSLLDQVPAEEIEKVLRDRAEAELGPPPPTNPPTNPPKNPMTG